MRAPSTAAASPPTRGPSTAVRAAPPTSATPLHRWSCAADESGPPPTRRRASCDSSAKFFSGAGFASVFFCGPKEFAVVIYSLQNWRVYDLQLKAIFERLGYDNFIE
ncbi:unnamed protein product [Urochloa humidicola]